jgi:hypothetical protein
VWKRLKGETCKRIFASDSGSLLDIWVFGTTSSDWRLLLNYLSAEYVSVYAEDGGRTMGFSGCGFSPVFSVNSAAPLRTLG